MFTDQVRAVNIGAVRCFVRRASRPSLWAASLLSIFVAGGPARGDGLVAGAVQVVDESRVRGTLTATSLGDGVSDGEFEVESVVVEVPMPSGDRYVGRLSTVWDPQTSLFWWNFRGEGPITPDQPLAELESRVAFYVSASEILGVEIDGPPPSLWCLRSSASASSLEKATALALETLATSGAALQGGTAQWRRGTSFSSVLPRDFYYLPYHPAPRTEVSVAGISRRGAGWDVTLAGREGRRAVVTLDALLGVTGATLVPESLGDSR